MTLPTRTAAGLYRNLATGVLLEGTVELDPYPGVWHDNTGHEVLKGGSGPVTLVAGTVTGCWCSRRAGRATWGWRR